MSVVGMTVRALFSCVMFQYDIDSSLLQVIPVRFVSDLDLDTLYKTDMSKLVFMTSISN